jgi:signal transduction histidine kinase/CheY-like chemotaxis protein
VRAGRAARLRTVDRSGPALPSADALLEACIEQTHDLWVLTDRTGRPLRANGRFRAAFGDATDLVSLTPPGSAGDAARAAIARAFADGALADTEITLRGADGSELALRARAHGVQDRLVWHLEDLGGQHALARQAHHLADLLDMAQEFGRLGVWQREIPSGKGVWDRHVFGFWGLDPAQGTPDFERAAVQIHPDDRVALNYRESTKRAGHYASRFRVIQPDGGVRWIHSQWEVKTAPDGTPDRALGIMMDDTPVYELARSLGDASAQLKLAVELADIAIWRHDLITDRMHYNDRAFAVLDIPVRPEGLSIAEVRSFIHPDDLPRVLASAQQALRSDKPTDMEARYRRSDGTWRHVLTRRVVQRAPDGTPLAFLGVALDVTDQVQHARAAAELAQRLDLAAAGAGIGIWSRDTETGQGTWNDQMYALCGRSTELPPPDRDEWLDRIVHPDDRALMFRARNDVVAAGGAMVEQEFRIVRPDGEVRWMVNRARTEMLNGHKTVIGVTIDVTERRRTEQALRSADERSALAARSAGIGTWEMALDGSGAERWDEQMFRLRGMTPQSRPPTREQRLAIVHPDDRARNVDARGGAMTSPQVLRYEFRVLLPDGSTRWLASRSMPVLGADGKVQRRIGVNWDVTDAKDAETAREQTAVAERASQAKSQFLARMSHELRTPLNAVLGFTQLLQIEADGAPERAAKLGHIRHAGEHLLSLIDGVLDLASLEAGNLKLELQSVGLADIVEQALPLVAALAGQHGVTLRTGVLPGHVRADRTRFVQVLVNLLTNAIKYNRRGGSVQIDSHPDGASVCLVVADTGRGMTGEQLAHLFEPFNRLGIEREGIEGTGVGLTIVKALVLGMEGTVAVRSRAGEGTSVEVRLPAAPAAAAAPARANAALPAAGGERGGQLLYIEDNAVNVLLVEELVERLSGLRIASEPTGAAGVARARELRPDLVLVDMQLPDFDGFEVLRRLRAAPETAAVACIALSANAMPEDIERALKAGFVDYWTKPIDFRAFLGALETRFPSIRAAAD